MSQSRQSEPQESVPKSVVGRLSLYLRELNLLLADDQRTISSTLLGKRLGLTDAQVRKDLAYFGQFGFPGVGYRCDQLVNEIRKILGTDQHWPVALVGCGNLGQALLGYDGFAQQGFSIDAAFDCNPRLIGKDLRGIAIQPMERFDSQVRERGISLAILAVPADAAPEVATRAVRAGINGILNFAPITLNVPDDVAVVSVDLATKLEQLAFTVVSGRRKR